MAPAASIQRVVLDANVLYPASLRDLLLRCAEKELYRLHLSQDIWTEVVRHPRKRGARRSARLLSVLRRPRSRAEHQPPATVDAHPLAILQAPGAVAGGHHG